MNCLKCGRKISAGQVFCGDCRTDMERYPVKSGTPVQLPPKNSGAFPRHPQKRRSTPNANEVIRRQKKTIRRLIGAVCILSLLLALLTAGVLFHLYRPHQLPLGQNYTTVQP